MFAWVTPASEPSPRGRGFFLSKSFFDSRKFFLALTHRAGILRASPTRNTNQTKTMKTIINLTPHAITVTGFMPIPPSGDIARVSVTRQTIGDINGIPAFRPTFGDVTGLPDPQPDTIYIVSAMVRSHPAIASRADVASPGALVRDASGNIIGCDGLDFN